MGLQCSVISSATDPKYQVALTEELIQQLKRNQPQYAPQAPMMMPSPMLYPSPGLPHYPHHPSCMYTLQPYFVGMPVCNCLQQPPPPFVRPMYSPMSYPEATNTTTPKAATTTPSDQKFRDIAELAKHSPWLAEEFYKLTANKDTPKASLKERDNEIKNQKSNTPSQKITLTNQSTVAEKHETVPPPGGTIVSLVHRSTLLPEPKVIKKLPPRMLKNSETGAMVSPIELIKSTKTMQHAPETLSKQISEKPSEKMSIRFSEKPPDIPPPESSRTKALVHRSFSETFDAKKSSRDLFLEIQPVRQAIKVDEVPQVMSIEVKDETTTTNIEAMPQPSMKTVSPPTKYHFMATPSPPELKLTSHPKAATVSPPTTFDSRMYTAVVEQQQQQSQPQPPQSATLRLSQAVALSRSLPTGAVTRLEQEVSAVTSSSSSRPTLSKAARDASTPECAIADLHKQLPRSKHQDDEGHPKGDDNATNK